MKRRIAAVIAAVIAAALVVAAVHPVLAQEAPPPKKAPRTSVAAQTLPDATPPSSSHLVQGKATVIDGEKLRIGNLDLRLFGVVPPQLSATFGPQARDVVDHLVTGQTVNCELRERGNDGRYLATCHAGNSDLALELLKRGLAVTARGSLSSTDLIISYLAAEQSAQAQKIGLWSVTTPPAVTVSATPNPVAVAQTLPAPPTPIQATPVSDVKKPADAPKPAPAQISPQEMAATDAQAAAIATSDLPDEQENEIIVPDQPGFFARYQILIAGLLMLITAVGITTAIAIQRRIDRRDEMRAMAAALRGELMAARAVCQARLKTIQSEADDKAAVWPRIRAILYQAYVGRIGMLGAELARQVASIYGQASDYASYYNLSGQPSNEAKSDATPKKQALQTLMHHIEEVLPKLATIEQTGRRLMQPSVSRLAPAPIAEYVPAVETVQAPPPVETTRVEETPVAEPSQAKPEAPVSIWGAARKLRGQRSSSKKKQVINEEQMPDYAAMIEQEIADMAFEDEGEPTPPASEKKTAS